MPLEDVHTSQTSLRQAHDMEDVRIGSRNLITLDTSTQTTFNKRTKASLGTLATSQHVQ